MFGETLRLELNPFGVRVVSVITGAIDTNIKRNSVVPKLPESSRYLAAQKQIADLAADANTDLKRMSVETFAEKVVNDVLQGANGKIWKGEYSSIVRLTNAMMPTGMLVSLVFFFFLVQRFDLNANRCCLIHRTIYCRTTRDWMLFPAR
jgi:1-acylglycerone phosphate reductase